MRLGKLREQLQRFFLKIWLIKKIVQLYVFKLQEKILLLGVILYFILVLDIEIYL